MASNEFRTVFMFLTNDCNLSCPYCFVKKSGKRMSSNTAKATIDFMLSQARHTNRIGITLFGGEPLLEFGLVKKLVKYAREKEKEHNKRIEIGITTNGTLFTREIMDFLRENDIGLVFSFEGDEKRMVKVKGKQAYEKCLWAVGELKKRDFSLAARVTVEPSDLRLADFAQHIFGLGFSYAAFVPVAEMKWDQEKTDRALMELAEYYISQARQGSIPKLPYINRLLGIRHGTVKPKGIFCGIGRASIAVTADGEILPCHRAEAWEHDFVLGNVFDGKIDEKKLNPFLEYGRNDFIGCDGCGARPYCSGSCLATAYKFNGNMFKPLEGHCIWTRAQVRAADHIYNVLVEKEKNERLLSALEHFEW